MERTFYFNEISNIETQTFDNSLEHFYRSGVEGLVRENIQNSLDACLDNTKPVKVQIELSTMDKNALPDIQNIEEHISSLAGGNDYTQKIIDHMDKALQVAVINVLTFEDSNTKGLAGADQIEKDTTYNIFAYKKGVHHKEIDSHWENIRGGSHGVGKIANNAASDIHLMYFANNDAIGHRHIGGTIQLIEHQTNGKRFRATGYFSAINEEKKYFPYENDYRSNTFRKDTQGLKLIIPFLKENYKNLESLVQAVVDNFFVALFEGKLEVSIINSAATILISQTTIHEISKNKEYYPNNLDDISSIKKNFTPLYIDTYLSHTDTPRVLQLNSNTDSYSFKLYFNYDENIKSGRVAIFRSIGMKISDYKIPGYVRTPFNAILIGGSKEDEFLKTLENESHTEISAEGFRDKIAKRNARKFLSNLKKEVGEIINKEMQALNPSDGMIDTSDLLYESEIAFKNSLAKDTQKIDLADGGIVKKKGKEKRKRRGKPMGLNNTIDGKSCTKRKPRVIKPSSESQNVKGTILAPNDIVHRIVLADCEILQFHLNNIESIPEQGFLNICFRVVDGDGKEYDNEYDLTKAYSDIRNYETNAIYDYDKDVVYHVAIKDGQINLRLIKKSNISDVAKIIYRLEVIS
ncbi:hypothetical protein QUW13_10655 [Enterococcus hirae]|nr:hypothetical protein [Enterococcus hirae]